MNRVNGTFSFEVEVALSGTFVKGHPGHGPSYTSGGDPPEPATFEDVTVEDLSTLKYAGRGFGKEGWLIESLLKGIDLKSPAAKEVLGTLFENILEFIGVTQTDDALFAELSEDE